MKLDDLKHEQQVTFRTGKAGDTCHEYGNWQTGPLYLIRREQDLPAKFRKRTKFWKKGDIVTLAVKGWPAEYGQNDYCGDGVFMAEEWCLEIKDLT